MKRVLPWLVLAVLVGWSAPSLAASCGTSKRPSVKANCKCQGKIKRGTLMGRFKTKGRFRLQRECKKTAQIAKRRCARSMGRVTLRWRRVRSYFRHVMGYKTGYCKIRYTCIQRRKKMSGMRTLPKLYKQSGRITILRTKLSSALANIKKRCAKPNRSVASAKLTKTNCRRRRCSVFWQCTYRKKRRVYWCK